MRQPGDIRSGYRVWSASLSVPEIGAGDACLTGPDDLLDGLDPADVPRRASRHLRGAVGGTSDDWAGLDEVMATECYTAVLVRPARVYSNPDA